MKLKGFKARHLNCVQLCSGCGVFSVCSVYVQQCRESGGMKECGEF